jgi:hypothetical protein
MLSTRTLKLPTGSSRVKKFTTRFLGPFTDTDKVANGTPRVQCALLFFSLCPSHWCAVVNYLTPKIAGRAAPIMLTHHTVLCDFIRLYPLPTELFFVSGSVAQDGRSAWLKPASSIRHTTAACAPVAIQAVGRQCKAAT